MCLFLLHFVRIKDQLSHSYRAFHTSLNKITFPKTLSEAVGGENWKNAIKVEMEAL